METFAHNKDPFERKNVPVIEMFYANFTVHRVVDHLVQTIRKNNDIHDILKDGHAFGVTQNQSEDATDFHKRRGIALKPYFDGYYHQEESEDERIFIQRI